MCSALFECYLYAVDVKAAIDKPDAMPNTPSAHRETLATNIRRLRRNAGLSQEALADRAGLHRTFVGSVERCERNISIDNIARLAVALDVTAGILLDEAVA